MCRYEHNENGKDEVGRKCGELIVELVLQEDRHDGLRQVTDCECDLHGHSQRRPVSTTYQLHHYKVLYKVIVFLRRRN